MKRLLAAILLVSILCTSEISVYAHGAKVTQQKPEIGSVLTVYTLVK